jgi:outer membrane immunogenic protein
MNNFKKLATALAISSAFVAAPAMAGDWEGGYVGLHAGWADGDRDTKYTVVGTTAKDGYGQSGALGGLQLGYNFELNPKWILGVKADWSWSDIDGSSNFPFGGSTYKGSGNYDWLASTTVRLGYLVNNKFMLFADGGMAFGGFEFSGSSGYNFNESRSGWTLGIGGEYRFTPRASMSLQYNYYDFGSKSQNGTAFAFIPMSSKADADLNVFKLGFNYKF